MSENIFEIVQGIEGLSIYFNNFRILGSKPYGGGNIIKSWKISNERLEEIIKVLENRKSKEVR